MIKKLAITLFLLVTAVVIAILAIAATRPGAYHIERTGSANAPPQTVFDLINDLNRFPEWSPWQKLDPAMKITIGGSGVGVGASYHWVGNSDVGEGRMTITDATPATHVGMKYEFLKPMASTCDVHFRIVPEGDGSAVTWAMDGNNDFMGKVMTLFMSMDAMIGKDFESGLANLKRVSETSAPGAPADSAVTDPAAAGKP